MYALEDCLKRAIIMTVTSRREKHFDPERSPLHGEYVLTKSQK
jgi:hypothetical protein